MSSLRTKVSLRLVGHELDPEAISKALCCEPTQSHKKGDLLEAKRLAVRAPTGVWLLDSSRQDDIESAIEELLGRVSKEGKVWAKLTSQFKAEFYIGVFTKVVQTGFSVSAPLLRTICSLGISLAFDVYCMRSTTETSH